MVVISRQADNCAAIVPTVPSRPTICSGRAGRLCAEPTTSLRVIVSSGRGDREIERDEGNSLVRVTVVT